MVTLQVLLSGIVGSIWEVSSHGVRCYAVSGGGMWMGPVAELSTGGRVEAVPFILFSLTDGIPQNNGVFGLGIMNFSGIVNLACSASALLGPLLHLYFNIWETHGGLGLGWRRLCCHQAVGSPKYHLLPQF
ncbi:hypothetical protein XENORESO_018099 [Xenotaenia resolanae]|uniref:Uncharacterized protein n=1 Tax=Xenotaenia resolanae TaxID=208358 RepID=A0ABV0WAU7_9TELE